MRRGSGKTFKKRHFDLIFIDFLRSAAFGMYIVREAVRDYVLHKPNHL